MISTTGFILALVTAVLFATFGLLSRALAVRSENQFALAFLYGVWGIVFSVPLVLIERGEFAGITVKVFLLTLLAMTLWGLWEVLQFIARKNLEASRYTIFVQLAPIVTFIGSTLFLNESVTPQKIGATSIIIAGNLIAVWGHGGAVSRRALFFALASAVTIGAAYVADKAVFQHYPLGFYIILSYLVPALYLLAIVGRDKFKKIKKEITTASWKLPLLGLVSVLGYYSLLSTFRLAEASAAVPIAFTSTILTALGGIIILRERGNILQKLAGAVFVVMGVILLR